MTRHLVFIVSSDERRLRTREMLARDAGHLALVAPSVARALFLLQKVRPNLLIVDAALADGRAGALVEHVRAVPLLRDLRIVVLGDAAPEERRQMARDGHIYLERREDDSAVTLLIAEILGDPGSERGWLKGPAENGESSDEGRVEQSWRLHAIHPPRQRW